MGNPLFDLLGAFSSANRPNTPQSNINGLISQFRAFQNQFSGDPKQRVQELLSSGQMTQEQFNKLSQMANQFQSLLK